MLKIRIRPIMWKSCSHSVTLIRKRGCRTNDSLFHHLVRQPLHILVVFYDNLLVDIGFNVLDDIFFKFVMAR